LRFITRRTLNGERPDLRLERELRNPIETAPKDGKTVILEDRTSGTYELAHWSTEEGAWVGANGNPCQISPTYWLAMKRAEGLGDECSSVSPQQGGAPSPPEWKPASLDVSSPEASSQPESVVGLEKQFRQEVRAAKVSRRFAASCGAAMVAVSLTYIYFRADLAAYLAQQDEPATGQQRMVASTSDLTFPRSEAVMGSAPSSAAIETVGIALTHPRQNDQRENVSEKELLKMREALAEAEERETRLKQTSETVSIELRRSLDKIVALENELAFATPYRACAVAAARRSHFTTATRATQSRGLFRSFQLCSVSCAVPAICADSLISCRAGRQMDWLRPILVHANVPPSTGTDGEEWFINSVQIACFSTTHSHPLSLSLTAIF